MVNMATDLPAEQHDLFPCLVDSQPDTQDVDRSEIRTQILLATASCGLKGRHSFTHMLTQVRTQDCKNHSLSEQKHDELYEY